MISARTFHRFRASVAIGLLGLASQEAAAQDFPSKPIKVVVGYAVGGGTDAIGRMLADRLGRVFKQPVLALRDPEVLVRFRAAGAEPMSSTPAEAAKYMREEQVKWLKVMKEVGIKPE